MNPTLPLQGCFQPAQPQDSFGGWPSLRPRASTHCSLLQHPVSDRASEPSWQRSHLSPSTPGLQLHRPSLSHRGLREPAERQQGEVGTGTFPPKPSVVISGGGWVLTPAVWCVGAQSPSCPGAQQVPGAP